LAFEQVVSRTMARVLSFEVAVDIRSDACD